MRYRVTVAVDGQAAATALIQALIQTLKTLGLDEVSLRVERDEDTSNGRH